MITYLRHGIRVLCIGLLIASHGFAATQPSPKPAAQDASSIGEVVKNLFTGIASKESDELRERIRVLEDRERSVYSLVVEGQRKSVDWWLSVLGIALTAFGLVVAVVGILLPVYWQKRERARINEAQSQAKQMLNDAQGILLRIEAHELAASKALRGTEAAYQFAQEKIKAMKSGDLISPSEKVAQQAAATVVLASPDADDISKLRALAIKASDLDQIEQASLLWQAVAAQDSNDAQAQFNAGYWLQKQLDMKTRASAEDWAKVSSYYESDTRLDPASEAGFNNWGNTLASEAQVLVASDQGKATKLWHKAYKKYAQALGINPRADQTLINWANVLGQEAEALARSDLSAARALWERAGQKYAQALRLNPAAAAAVASWGDALSDEAEALARLDLAAARVLWREAGQKFDQALKLKPDEPDVIAAWADALADEAEAVAASDLTAAIALWQRADENFQKALALKPAAHEFVSNWGGVLLRQTHILRTAGLASEADKKLAGAHKLLQDYVENNAGTQGRLSYNLACCYAMQGLAELSVAQLEIGRLANDLPDRAHIEADMDFGPIRNTPEFQLWWQQTFS